MKILWILLISTYLLEICSLYLSILNKDVLLDRNYSVPLSIGLRIEDDNANNLQHFDNMKLCLLVDGLICKCYSTDLHETSIYLDINCAPIEKFWFSVLLLDDIEDTMVISNAYMIPSYQGIELLQKLTMILTLTINDLSRAMILLYSLSYHLSYDHHRLSCPIYELLVIVPDSQTTIIESALHGYLHQLCFNISIIPESQLFDASYIDFKSMIHAGGSKYALQMAIKLLISKHIHTEFYITLDADIIMLDGFSYDDMVHMVDGNNRAKYHHESRYLHHPDWYDDSERYLNISSSYPHLQGFGVTPAILSTYGSLLTISLISAKLTHDHKSSSPSSSTSSTSYVVSARSISRLNDIFSIQSCGSEIDHNPMLQWVYSLGRHDIWTEYTLYRTTLDYLHTFDRLHIDEASTDHHIRLHCYNIWYEDQLPWQPQKLEDEKCIFSVIQSSTRYPPSTIFETLQQYYDSS